MGVHDPVTPPAAVPVTLLPAPAVAAGLAVGVLAVSTAAILIRVADAPALALAFYRCAGGAVALAPFAVRSRRRPGGRPRLPHLLLAASGLLLALHFALWITSLSYTTVASAVVLVTMGSLFVAAGATLFLSEPASRRTWLGMALAVAGAVGVTVADVGGVTLAGEALLGNVLAFAGAMMVAGYLLIGRAVRPRVPVVVYGAGVYGVAAAALLVACVLSGTPLTGYTATTWLAIGGLVVGPQLLGHTVFNTVLSTVSATVVAVVVLAEPVGATVMAWLLLDELPTPGFWVAAPLILAGVYLAATTGRGPARPVRPAP